MCAKQHVDIAKVKLLVKTKSFANVHNVIGSLLPSCVFKTIILVDYVLMLKHVLIVDKLITFKENTNVATKCVRSATRKCQKIISATSLL